ncbi:hypothetical protein SAZ10_14100 [Mesorhizobium sp. BAC0120]|uniref:tetratricopeptide repeat protein n=1 Tax=Mesorhizobium sp. BAC0120 TaxID=3090670 RepID=UPI00298D32C6|nr:hypothetical protein [Mesorhizobium sp. BAC0120]MDW6022891.1 hypothetical protein [Mesorhizobium sp. BAC0120]
MSSGSGRHTYAVGDDTVSDHDAKQELERILSDPEFHCTVRHRKFLRFVTDELLQGRGDAVKAYTIAVDVFGRPPSFDPSTDPIVRIEATRLRAALTRYYELHGNGLSVRIELPKGRYIPVFTRSRPGCEPEPVSLDDAPAPAVASQPPTSPLQPSARTQWKSVVIGAVAGLASAGLFVGIVFIRWAERPAFSKRPNLTVELRLDGRANSEAAVFRDQLLVALSNFQTVTTSAPDAITASVGDAATSGTPRSIQSRYRLLLKYGEDREGTVLWWHLLDTGNGETVRAGIIRPPNAVNVEPTAWLAGRLATQLASPRGVINRLETAREVDRPTLGNGCVVRAVEAMDSREPDELGEVRACLERSLALRENDADAHAVLAGVLAMLGSGGLMPGLMDKAVEHAGRAVELAPDSDRGFLARMMTQFRLGNSDAAIQAGRRALELNPNNPRTIAKLAYILFVTGHWGEGAQLARASLQQGESRDDVESILSFDAYRRGQYAEALQHLRQINRSDCYCLQVLKVAILGQLGRKAEAEAAIADLRRERPQFEASFGADLAHRSFAPSLITLLKAGLEKAGVKVA